MQKTKLSWPDYKKAALKLKSQGLGYPKIYQRLGIPVFNGVEYKLESDKGNIKRKTREAARAGKTASTKTRNSNKAISTPKGTDIKATNKLVKEINGAGGQADHKVELSRSGNAMRPMDAKRRQLYLKRFGNEVGHQTGNIQNLSAKENGQKNIDYRRLDSHLRKLGKTPNVGKPNFRFPVGITKHAGKALGANLAGLLLSVSPEIDERTGGHIDKAIKRGMNSLKIAGKKVFDAGVSKMIENQRLGYELTLQ